MMGIPLDGCGKLTNAISVLEDGGTPPGSTHIPAQHHTFFSRHCEVCNIDDADADGSHRSAPRNQYCLMKRYERQQPR